MNAPYQTARYSGYHEALQAPGVWQLFLLAVRFRKAQSDAQDQQVWAKNEKRRKDGHRLVGEEIGAQRAWVEATEALMEVFDYSQGSKGARDLFDLVMTVAAGNYHVPSPDESMTESDILNRIAGLSA